MASDASREIARWCDLQTAFWRTGAATNTSFAEEWARLNDTVLSLFLIDLAGGGATIRPKPVFYAREQIAAGHNVYTERALLYRDYLREVARQHRIRMPLTLAIDVSDFPSDSFAAPVLSFQKQLGSPNILFPDVDFFYQYWYVHAGDPVPIEAKEPRISFVGSTTGAIVTAEMVEDGSMPRLALAEALSGHPRVDFRIGLAVQCTDEARALIEAKPYFSGPVPFEDQLRARFVLSVDGNGATCSRVVRTLMSRSVLLKYASDAMLYYFDGLVPGEHYLPVASVADMERVLELDDAALLDRAAIAAAAQAFAGRYLTRPAVNAYAAGVLERLSDIIHGPRRRWFGR